MENQNKGEENQQATTSPSGIVSWTGKLEEHYRKTKEHAETYPYVWASYILVYGGFGLWFTYRWRKLRKMEDRVRTLQGRLRKIYEDEEAARSATSVGKVQKKPPADKVSE